jgi:hypothetical protein
MMCGEGYHQKGSFVSFGWGTDRHTIPFYRPSLKWCSHLDTSRQQKHWHTIIDSDNTGMSVCLAQI